MKGIAEDVYNFLISKESLTSVSDVIRHCRTFETLKQRRITPKFGRLANVTTVASVETTPTVDLATTIRQIVREELCKHESMTREVAGTSRCYFPQDVATPQLEDFENPSVNAAEAAESRPIHRSSTTYYQRSLYPQRFRTERPYRRPTNDYVERRTYANEHANVPEHVEGQRRLRPAPVCYNCGVTGHISRYCDRSRIPRYERPPPWTQQPGFPPFEERWTTQPRPKSSFWQGPFRNRSPASDRSVTPPPAPRLRRSPSPRRRSSSPHQEN